MVNFGIRWLLFDIPNEEDTIGSRFGVCSSGGLKVMGMPCEHMIAVLKSGKVVGLNENNFKPPWWMIGQMRLQYPIETALKVDIDITALKEPCLLD